MGRQSQYDQKKQTVLDAIASLVAHNGKSPSFREISGQTGISVATLHSYLKRLQEEGLIEWTSRSHRSLRIVNPSQSSSSPETSPAPQPSSPTGTSTQTEVAPSPLASIDVGF